MASSVKYPCINCGTDCCVPEHNYMLDDELWKSVVPNPKAVLCLKCLAKLLGRPLEDKDFKYTPEQMARRMLTDQRNS